MSNSGQDIKYLLKKPNSLKLEFSKAASYGRFTELFLPSALKHIDPNGYVARRLDADYRRTVKNGCAIGLSDENQRLRTLAVVFQFHVSGDLSKQHDYTEFGSGLGSVQGYGCGTLLGAAICLKEWLNHPPKNSMVTEIKRGNLAVAQVYNKLGWEAVTNKDTYDLLFNLCYSNVADENGAPVGGPPLSEKNKIQYYLHTNKTLVAEAKILLNFLDQGGVKNKNGDTIIVDFSNLDSVGLTRPVIEAISMGEHSRKNLRKIGGGSPPGP